MSNFMLRRTPRPVVEIAPRRRLATITLNPFRFVFSFPPEEWAKIVAEVERSGCRYRFGTETLIVLNVPLEDAPELASRIAGMAANYLQKSGLWLSEDGAPPLAGMKGIPCVCGAALDSH